MIYRLFAIHLQWRKSRQFIVNQKNVDKRHQYKKPINRFSFQEFLVFHDSISFD